MAETCKMCGEWAGFDHACDMPRRSRSGAAEGGKEKAMAQDRPGDFEWPDTPFRINDSFALLMRRGSESHGLYIPPETEMGTDDRDLMGVVLPPPAYYIGIKTWKGTAESIKGVWDVVVYDFRKFVHLLCKQNPNVLGCLWLDHSDYLAISPLGRELLVNRGLFVARHAAYEAFAGYAGSQAKRLQHGVFNGYMGEKRKALVAKYGYDTKNATHLIRLLRMGREFLLAGRMQVKRTADRDELIAIKRGSLKLEELKALADREFAACKDAYMKSTLPEAIDEEAVNALVESVVSRHLRQSAAPAPTGQGAGHG